MQPENTLAFSAKRVSAIIFVILSLYPLIGMGIDLIAPSLPAISHSLQVSNVFSKNLITIYLMGYALGNFFVGFLSDALGRRKLIVGGLLIFVLVSLSPAFFDTTYMLLFARFLQGVTIAAAAVVARAIISDVLAKERLMRVAPMTATMWGIGPIIGPIIGGYLQYYFNWQAGFYFFALFAFIELIAIFIIIPETHCKRQALNFTQVKTNFLTITTHRLFMGMAILMGLSYSLLIVFNTLGPFLIQTELGHSPVYFGHMALYLGLVFLLGTLICRKFMKRYQPEEILLVAIPLAILIALTGLLGAYLAEKNIWVIMLSSLIMFLSCGIIYPAAMSKGISLFRHLAGSASAILNLLNILITCLTALFMSFVSARNAIPMTSMYFGLMLLSGLCYWLLVPKKLD